MYFGDNNNVTSIKYDNDCGDCKNYSRNDNTITMVTKLNHIKTLMVTKLYVPTDVLALAQDTHIKELNLQICLHISYTHIGSIYFPSWPQYLIEYL